ncbi:hypothetical protein HAT86_05540 [Roseovarius gahaiensis]|uniref:Rhamnan synthesis protein F n=1 Tax=Roseovarius gahaiensis TaxID=2716691 RepID=A0A967BCB4_9RHOB|nr:rhamnan synthesis F family protein [Roseovarius gahaiensis]NHQ73930.1 hypothetical protein [Roseovarius gahaiensis]
MKKLPLWKLKREAKRAARQIIGLPGLTWEYLFLRPLYDRKLSRQKVVHDGAKPIAGEMAIYLVYAPEGLLGSHHDMLAQLAADGITPVVVSNLPLSQQDRDVLLAQTAMVIERPNVGYDFGGYRDAVLKLAPNLPKLDRLYILNDSVWMVEAPQSWFQQVRATGCDFVGATSNFGIARVDAEDFRSLEWHYTPDHANFHYASYALAVGPNILRDPRFMEYWHDFRLSNNKKRTVRRGEIGLTKWVLTHSYSHCATCDVVNLDQDIEAMDNAALDDLARHLIIPEDTRLTEQHAIALQSDPATEQGRKDRIQIILTAVARQAMGYAMPYFTLAHRNFQFVKKSPLRLSRRGAEIKLEILSQLDGPKGRRAYEEAQNIFALRNDA